MGNVPPNAAGTQGAGQHGFPQQYGGATQQQQQQQQQHQQQQQQQQQQPGVRSGGGVSYPAPMVQGSTYNAGHQQHDQIQYQPYAQQQNVTTQPNSSSHNAPGTVKQRRSASDISMTDAQHGHHTEPGQLPFAEMNHKNLLNASSLQGGFGTDPVNAALMAAAEEDVVPTVFRWEHGGRQVYITGTFNDWSRQIPMHRSGNDFTYIHNLKRGKHAFKFIVDDEWRYAPDQATVADIEGRINNFIDVSDFIPYTGDKHFEERVDGGGITAAVLAAVGQEDTAEHAGENGEAQPKSSQPHAMNMDEKEVFQQAMPDLDEYTKEPPPLPPHLRHIILNKAPQLSDTAALPVPQHVALNHLYCTAIKDNMMVLGITQRHKTKFVTTVYYSPCEG